ncbi:tetratricopeptide repeat protein [Flavobacterium sp. NKUCC04_CG]|uniref:tetratricopeptide repeat protein n=1 Tax=Flavobacterium sp. NKUCC04_CG TaxID=2842121 RepID=UPI001C5A93EF|nr:tetratricopeptide repeat protein [Flavobacterium sp. NKUCC04_CG]MBW3518366.1 tetratricopeptide repeat protein [Flavobacterium sp. NKUCC04_CG]
MRNCYFLGLFFLLFLYACSDTRDRQYLSKAEECYHSFPDSARFYLDIIDFPEKMSDENQARWILLNVRLHQKSNISLQHDTLILKALDYYTSKNIAEQVGRANLYAGRVFEARQEHEMAKKYFNEAIIVGKNTANYKLAGRSASELAEIYQDDRSYEQAIDWFTHSYHWAFQANDIYYQINALRKRADCYLESQQLQKALEDYDKALDEVPDDKEELRSDIYKNRAIAHLKLEAFEKAKSDIKTAMKFAENTKLKTVHLWILADIFEREDQMDSAYFYNNKAFLEVKQIRNSADVPTSLESLLDINASDKIRKPHLESYQLYRSVSDSIYEKERFNATLMFENKFHQEVIKNKNKNLVIRNQQYLLLLAIALLVIFFIFYIYRVKSLTSKAMLVEKDIAIGRRDQTINTYKISASKRLDIYRRMVGLSLAPNSERYVKLLDDYNQIVHGSSKPFRFEWKDFEELLHLVYPGFKDKLSKLYPGLQSKELQVILLQKGGLSIQEIADLLHLSIHTIYRRNSEIRKKMQIPENQSLISFLGRT